MNQAYYDKLLTRYGVDLLELYGLKPAPTTPQEAPSMHITLKDNESVIVQRIGHDVVVELTPTGLKTGSGLNVRRRKASVVADSRFTNEAYVRVDIAGTLYCYNNVDSVDIGDHVAVVLPNGEPRIKVVEGFGRGLYTGPVYKDAKRVELPS